MIQVSNSVTAWLSVGIGVLMIGKGELAVFRIADLDSADLSGADLSYG